MEEKAKTNKRKKQKNKIIFSTILFLFIFLVYHFTGEEKTHLDYFVRLSDAFLNQRLYLTQNPPWLNELVPLNGKYYVVYPPMPAIVILPFVFLFGANFNQTVFAQIIGALNSVLVYLLFKKLKYSTKIALLLAITLSLATNHWFLASIGSAWYLAHVVAIFFLLLAFYSFFSSKFFLAGFCLGAAYWSRLPIIIGIFYFLFLFQAKEKNRPKFIPKLFLFFCGVSIFIFLDGVYNFVRFGTLWNQGYALIPGVLKEPWFNKGIFHYSYIPRNFVFFFNKMPVLINHFPFIIPSLEGMAFWLTSPVFLFLIKASWQKKENLLAVVNFLLGIIVILTHGTVGFSQFGFRFALDFVPLLLFPLAEILKSRLSFCFYFLLILSIFINAWGTILINKFHFWGW